MENLRDNLSNPFDWMYYWCKGEIYDIKALVQAISQREAFEKQLRKLKQKRSDANEDLGNLEGGKTTMRTVFKSSSDTTTIKSQIENSERDIENLGVIHDIITIYLGEKVLPKFKKNKISIYR